MPSYRKAIESLEDYLSNPDRFRCKTCRFWESLSDKKTGLCKRYAPFPRLVEGVEGKDPVNCGPPEEYSWRLTWPQTQVSSWCGDWRD